MKKRSLLNDVFVFFLTTCVFVAVFGTAIYMSRQVMLRECDQKAQRDLDLALEYFDLEMSRCEQSLATFSAMVLDNGKKIPSEEELFVAMEKYLQNDPWVSGIVAGFEPGVFPDCPYQYGMVPLVRHEGDSLVRYNLGEIRDELTDHDWYALVKKTDKKWWSRPFLSEEGELITNISLPLHDKDGKFIGVIALNLPMRRISDRIAEIKPFPEAVVRMVLSTDLTYFLHPNPAFLMKETLPGEFAQIGVRVEDQMLEDIHARRRGRSQMAWGTHTSYCYYAPLDKAMCAVIIDVPEELVYEAENEVHEGMIISLAIGIVLIMLGLLYKNRDRIKRSMH